jgi:hypothetical protein
MKLSLLIEDFDSEFRDDYTPYADRNKEHDRLRIAETKREIIKLAASGAKRPNPKSKDPKERRLANFINSHASPASHVYDMKFRGALREIAPHWFSWAVELKDELLNLAKSGAKRPNIRSKDPKERKLGQAFDSYYRRTSKAYDPEFIKKIKAIAPEWLIYKTPRVEENIRKLLEIAKSGGQRPSWMSSDPEVRRLANALTSYMRVDSTTYRKDFANQLRKLRPEWFIDILVAKHKKRILEIAKGGEKRPRYNAGPEERRLAVALALYIDKSGNSYDKEFDEMLRKMRPDWFIRRHRGYGDKKQPL